MEGSPQEIRDEVVDALVVRAKRRGGGVAIRNSFVQRGKQASPLPGPLSRLVKNHDERALDLYLMLRLVTSSDEVTGAWDVALSAQTWSDGLGLPAGDNDGTAAVSKAWRRLADRGLIARERKGNAANVTLLHESGEGQEYTYPGGQGSGRYFKLSEHFWTDEERWYRTLSLSAKAMLLIASSLKPGFSLPLEQAPKWYGISPDTAGRGLKELDDKGLLRVGTNRRRAPLSPTRYAIENTYILNSPFAQTWRTRGLATVTELHVDAGGA